MLVNFNIQNLPLPQALVAVTLQAQVSLGGADPSLCGRALKSLRGPHTPVQAYRALLDGSRCEIEPLDAGSFRLKLMPAHRPRHKVFSRPENFDNPDVLTVTATRRREPLKYTPAAISVITAADMAGREGGLAEVAPQVAGFSLTNLGPGRDKIMLRGVSDGVLTGLTQSTVGLYLDDSPITYSAPNPDLLLTDMARIEVLKGPQGALYGEGSISGVVRLVTRKPDLDAAAAFMRASGGFSASAGPSSRLEAMINLPILVDRAGLRAVVYNDRQGGYIQDRALDSKNTNSSRRYGGRLGLKWRLGENWDFLSSLTVQEISSQNSQYVSGGLGDYTRAVPVAEPHDNDFVQMAAKLEGQTSLGRLSLSVNHLHHHLATRYDASILAAHFPSVAAGLIAYDEKQDVELTTGEVNLVSPSSQPLRWLVGIYAASSSQRFSPRLEQVAGGQSLYREQRDDHLNDIAPFGEITYDFNNQWTIIAGARLSTFHHETESLIHQLTATGATSASALDQSLKSSQVSHKLVVRYRANADLMMYLQTAEGYRGGGFNTGSLAGSERIPGHYRGDELVSYEAGVKFNPAGGRLHLGLAAFKLLWKNIQSDQLQSTGLPVTVNIGDGVNQGIEIEAAWRATSQLTLYGAAMFNDPHLTRPNRLYVTAEDSGLPNIAHQTANLRARFETLVWGNDWVSEADLGYQGVSHLDFGPLQVYKMGGYTTLNLRSTLTLGPWQYGVRADNLLAARANTLAYGNPFTLRAGPQSVPLRPATFWVSVSRHF